MPISTTHPAQHRQAPFLGFLNACLQTKHLDPVEKLFDEHFRRRSQTLARYLSLTSWNLEKHPRPPPHHAVCTNTHRFGLNMSAQKFCIAKSLISTLYAGCGTLACLRSIKLSPYAVIYAAMDLDIPLPDDFDFWFLWRHLEQLLEREREADLVADSGILPPVHPCPTMPPEFRVDTDEDPDGALQQLWCLLYSSVHSLEPRRPLSEPPPVQLSVGATHTGLSGEMYIVNHGVPSYHCFRLPRLPSNPACASSREAYALLDAACCWGLAWQGRTVRVTLTNARLVWALNDFADAMAEFPVVELLLALATRCGFEFAATHVPGAPASPSRRAHGQHGSVFSDGSGLVLQLMDAAMADAARAAGDLRDVEHVVLSSYQDILIGTGALGYTEDLYEPGLLYAQMRARQTALRPDGSAPVLAPARQLVRADDAPVTHLSPPAWQSTLQQRRAATAAASSARSGGATSMHGTLRATRAPAPQSVLPWVARRTPEEQIEAQKRVARRIVHARESTMRLRAACDDAAWVAVRAPVVDRWCDADDQ